MFLIEQIDIEKELAKINTYLKKCLWMDFEFAMLNEGKIVISGSVDFSTSDYAIDIEFDQPYFVSSLLSWHTDTSKPFIQLVDEEEKTELIKKYRVENGNYLFKISAEDFEEPPIFIAAKKISCKILNDNPFPEN